MRHISSYLKMVRMTNTLIDQPCISTATSGYDPSAVTNFLPKRKPTIYDWLGLGDENERKKKSIPRLIVDGVGKKVDKSSVARGVYGGLDGWSSSYSMVKYSFDLFYTTSSISSSDIMHTWMLTPEGIATVATWSAFVIGLSILGNVYEKDDKEKFKQNIAHFQSYFRVVMKGLKNSYKGIRSTLQAASLLSAVDLRALMVPLGLVLGIISVINRLWYQKMVDLRKANQKCNKESLKAFKRGDLSKDRCEQLIARIEKQNETNSLALLSAFQSGLTDGLYLFMGSLAIASLCPPILITVLIFSALFSLLTIINRMYEEKIFQDKLTASQEDIKLAVCGQALQEKLMKLLVVFQQQAAIVNDQKLYTDLEEQHSSLHVEADNIVTTFNDIHKRLEKLQSSTYTSAILTGLRHGLYAYSALTSVLFGIATICTIAAAPVSPFVVLAFAIAGVVCLIGFLAHALWNHSQQPRELKDSGNKTTLSNKTIAELLTQMKDKRDAIIEKEEIEKVISDGMLVNPSPQYLIQEGFEVVRSFTSGLTKAQKSVDYTLNPLQELDDKGHPHDTPEMLWVTAGVSLVFAVGLGLKACAKGFGKDDEEKVDGTQPKTALAPDQELPTAPALTTDNEFATDPKRGTDPELAPHSEPAPSQETPIYLESAPRNLLRVGSNPDLACHLVGFNRNFPPITSLENESSDVDSNVDATRVLKREHSTKLSANRCGFLAPPSRRPSVPDQSPSSRPTG